MKNKFQKFKSINKIKRNRGIFSTRKNKIRLDANERISSFDSSFLNKRGILARKAPDIQATRTCLRFTLEDLPVI